jgi:hypothetical protein
MEAGANVGLHARELTDQEHNESTNTMLKEQQMGQESQEFGQQQKLAQARIPLELMQLSQQKQQMQADASLKTMQMQLSKAESDRQFQTQQQQMANEMALKQQQMDLQSQAAAQKFQAQQQYQQYYNQLTNGDDPMDPAQAASLAFARFGPQMGESMSGTGSMIKATTPPPPPQLITDSDSGQQAWQYGGSLTPIKAPADADEKNKETDIKSKSTFVNNFLRGQVNNPDFMSLSRSQQLKEALEAWDQISDDGSDEDGSDTQAEVPVSEKYKIIEVK